MLAEAFFALLLEELELHPALKGYYRFLNDRSKQAFRTAYYLQRLRYIEDHLSDLGDYVWDCGCGYGTTNLFLALNGIRSFGNTLEYYFAEVPQRMEFWSRYGDTSLFECSYANTFDLAPDDEIYSAIIVQDTLHHLEPLPDALALFYRSLRPGGKVLAIEENGSNLIQQLKLFKQRGTKRIIEIEDTTLGKKILMGNENIRSTKTWRNVMETAGFIWDSDSLQHLRILPAKSFVKHPMQEVVEREQRLIGKNPVLKKYFSFGINFTSTKPGSQST